MKKTSAVFPKTAGAFFVQMGESAGNGPKSQDSDTIGFEKHVTIILHKMSGDIPVTLWNTTTGYVLGISRMENAEKALRQGIEYAEAQLAGKTIVVSEDGAGVRKTEYWVAESVKTAYDTALANAKTVLANADATNAQRDAATQALGAAYGTLVNGSRNAKGMQQGTN